MYKLQWVKFNANYTLNWPFRELALLQASFSRIQIPTPLTFSSKRHGDYLILFI